MPYYKMGKDDTLRQDGHIIISENNSELIIGYMDGISGAKNRVHLFDEEIEELYSILHEHLGNFSE